VQVDVTDRQTDRRTDGHPTITSHPHGSVQSAGRCNRQTDGQTDGRTPDQYITPTRASAECRSMGQTDRQTDGRTDTRPLHHTHTGQCRVQVDGTDRQTDRRTPDHYITPTRPSAECLFDHRRNTVQSVHAVTVEVCVGIGITGITWFSWDSRRNRNGM